MQTQPDNFRAGERQTESKPCYIYIFEHTPFFGVTSLIHLVRYDQNLTVVNLPSNKGADPQLFLAAQISHSEIEQSAEQNAPATQISLVLNDNAEANELKRYFANASPAKINVTVARVALQALDGEVDWLTDCYTVIRGRKTNVSLEGSVLMMQVINLMLQEDGRVPRFYYQKTCQHDFGRGNGEIITVMFTKADKVDPGLIGHHGLFDHVAQHLIHRVRLAAGCSGHIAESIKAQ